MKLSILFLIIFTFSLTADAQVTKTIKLEGGDAFDLAEVGALITKDQDDIKIQFILPASNRPKGYENIDLQENDNILMANGKKIKDTKELKSIYDKVKIGGEFKLGIKRNTQMMIVSIKKADPESLPKRKMLIMDDGDNESVLLAGQGILISEENNKPVIKNVLDLGKENVKNSNINEGDAVTFLNNTEIKSFNQFKKSYEGIKIGENVDLKFSGGKSFSFKKEEDKGLRIIKKEIK